MLYSGIVRNDDLDYIHFADLVSKGDFTLSLITESRLEDIPWRFALFLPVGLLYRIFGISEFTSVIYPILCAILCIVFIYGIGKLAHGEKAGLLAALIWAVFPLTVNFATDLLPDLPMTTFTTGAFYFFYLGQKKKWPWSIKEYSLCFIFLVWAFFIKAFALATLIFFVLYVGLKFSWDHIIGPLFSSTTPKKRRIILIIPMIGILLMPPTIIYQYFVSNRNSFLAILLRSSRDILQLFWGINESRFDPFEFQNDLFLTLTPLLIISIAWVLTKYSQRSSLILFWAAFGFVFLEWGSVDTGFAYQPFYPRTGIRNYLSLFVPFLIIAGIYLANFFRTRYVRWMVSIIAISMPLLSYYIKAANFEGFASTAISIATFLALIGAVFSPALISRKSLRYRQVFASVLVGSLIVGMLRPTPPDHFSNPRWANQSDLINSLRLIAPYLEENQEYPIWVFSKDMALSLNYASNLKLGYDHFETRQVTDTHRIGIDLNTAERKDSFFTVFYSDYRGAIPSHWWKIAQHKIDEDLDLNFYRSLSKTDASSEIDEALKSAENNPSDANLFRLYGAARNALDLNNMISAWQQLRLSKGYNIPLSDVSPVIFDLISTSPDVVADYPLLQNADFCSGLDNWESADGMELTIHKDGEFTTPLIEIAIPKRLETRGALYQFASLEPNTLYFFALNIRSTIAVNLLQFEDTKIETTNSAGEIYGSWTNTSGIFITPHWDGEPKQVKINLIEARQNGSVLLSNLVLAKIQVSLK